MLYLEGLAGLAICAIGVWELHKNMFEEGKSIKWAIIIILAGILFIANFFYKITFHA